MLIWLILAYSMQAPAAVRTKMYTMSAKADVMTAEAAAKLKAKLAKIAGVIEVAVLPQERTLILKVDKLQDWDESQVLKLLRG